MGTRRAAAVRALLPVIFLAYAVGRVVTTLPALHKPRELADTVAYTRISREPLLSPEFWGSTRPFTFPLLLKTAAQDYQIAAWMQLGISVLAWGLLAWMIARRTRVSWVKPIAFGIILAFSLDRHIAGWDTVMMSESLSVSLLALFVALGLWLCERWRPGRAAAWITVGALLAFTRDTNAWLLLLLVTTLLAALVLRWGQTRLLGLAVPFALISMFSMITANMGARWMFPLGNLIANRVLPDPVALSYFESCEMPVSPALVDLSGGFANSEERAMFEDPELKPFRDWLRATGRACYLRWLLQHPTRSLGDVMSQFDALIGFSEVDAYFARAYDPLMPVIVGRLFYPERNSLLLWIVCLAASAVLLARPDWRSRGESTAFVLLTILVPPHLFLAWHGDAMAPERHALSAGVQLYLAFCWLLILGLDAVAWHGSDGRPPRARGGRRADR